MDRAPREGGSLRQGGNSRGTNQSGVRAYNERLLLSLIRDHRSLPKAEMARLTGLSAQTISVIVKQLETEGLLLKNQPLRGRVGQPSVPFSLAPDGSFSLGLKIGRRSADLVLIDFLGKLRDSRHLTYRYPEPDALLAFAGDGVAALVASLPASHRSRVGGLGIALPFELWSWQEEAGAPPAVLEAWRGFDVRLEMERRCGLPVHLCNDATAACAAELIFGNAGGYHDFVYFFVGSFIGGGIVLDGALYPGRSGNAGALASMPVPAADGTASSRQLVSCASIRVLEKRLEAAGLDPRRVWRPDGDWTGASQLLDNWIAEVAANLAYAIVAAAAVIDFEAAILDGAVPAAVRRRLVEATAARLDSLDRRGLSPIAVVEGSIGNPARAIGGACLPLLADFGRDRDVLFKAALKG